MAAAALQPRKLLGQQRGNFCTSQASFGAGEGSQNTTIRDPFATAFTQGDTMQLAQKFPECFQPLLLDLAMSGSIASINHEKSGPKSQARTSGRASIVMSATRRRVV
jgi:hypothetical protein